MQSMTLKEHVDALAGNLPSGRVWAPKVAHESNLNRFLLGWASTYEAIDQTINRFINQSIPPDTTDFLSEWEDALGIPDGCFAAETDPDRRRRNIRIKLAVLAGISTAQNFIDLAALFGFSISVSSGIDHVPVAQGGYETKTPVLNIPADFSNVVDARFTMVVVETSPDATSFVYDYPIPFTTADKSTMECLFRKLAPANSRVLFTS